MAVLAVVAVSSAMAADFVNFTDPTKVNLLERWNFDGSYYYATSNSGVTNPPEYAQMFRNATGAFHGAVPSGGIDGMYQLGGTVTLGELSLVWRDVNHLPTSWTIYAVYDDGRPDVPIATGLYSQVVPAVGSTLRWTHEIEGGIEASALRIASSNTSGPEHKTGVSADLVGFEAYLAPGGSLPLDGTFNIFREEIARGTLGVSAMLKGQDVSGTMGSIITSGTSANYNCDGTGWVEWTFSQEYTFVGANLWKATGGLLTGFMIHVGVEDEDAENGWRWETVGINFEGMLNESKRISFGDSESDYLTGSRVRISWENAPFGNQDIFEFQLFGYATKPIPEPVTMTLLALGGVAMLRRRWA
jgi:hypothetical protein